jgi:peptide/nickel transport system ATP-binding protein
MKPLSKTSNTAREPLLQVEHLSIGFPTRGGVNTVVQDLTFSLSAGESLAIVGESGSGKTVLGKALLGLLPESARTLSGSVHFAGRDLTRPTQEDWRAVRGTEIGMVFQEPMVSLNPAQRVGDQLMEGLMLRRAMSRTAARHAAIDMLERVQVNNASACMRSYPHRFSGGMRQRILLAGVMLLRPRLLIADEPTTALDCVVQKEVLDVMTTLTRDEGVAMIFISHNLPLVAAYTSRVLVMRRGVLVEQGMVDEVLSKPRHPYTVALLDALPKRTVRPPAQSGPPLLEAHDVSVSYSERVGWFGKRMKPVVQGVSLRLHAGETVAIVGESGSGKTTLTRAILGLVPLAGGTLNVAGQDLATLTSGQRFALRRRIQVVFQDPYSSLDPTMKVRALVAEGLRLERNLDAAARRERVEQMMDDVGLDGNFGERLIHELSGGQRQRVAIARALVMRPDVLIADEPVSALDVTVQKQVLDMLVNLQKRFGFACLLISHDLGVVEQIADQVHVMLHGRVVESGSRDEIFDRPKHAYTRRLLSAIPDLVADKEGGFRIVTRQFDADAA